ncbi:septum site-determining protein MinC [filamentous cyanobacterium CCP5]|nr:septum site-determining protein MinC [filamentous cyanobacterium CCP5]
MTSEFSPPVTELPPAPEEAAGRSGEVTATSEAVPEISAPEAAASRSPQADAPQTNSPQADRPRADAPSPEAMPLAPQVRFRGERGRLQLLLPTDGDGPNPLSWAEIYQQLKQRLDAGERFWQARTVVHLVSGDRLLDVRQLQAVAELLGSAQLQLKRVYTSRRQTALAAATAGYSVEQQSEVDQFVHSRERPGQAMAEPLYLQTTVRSGVEVRHPGSLIIFGDANPGSALVAEGDILVWGRLRGIAHAGVGGNRNCRIMALHMQPTQLRIADVVARPPEKPPSEYLPEVAYIGSDGMRIAIAADFARSQITQ